ncbi:MAG TPA: SulP family inorganic anion transporter [Pseudomonadota bacterium]|nr:STAS domain-containing protein [Rhodanobacteraceae bacterium]MBP9153905.1 STAS domain-containing protein [Xanthomonadales bacterium]HQW81145.1 SulP family inorganic anion transporter [Pseudomonadota bacterium]
MAALPRNAPRAFWHLYVPKLVSVLRRGYGVGDFRHDVVAGLTVAVVALPLAMALAIASGTTPEKGLHTAIIGGFLISFFGGSRVQVGGPTAAFIPVVFAVIEKFGYGGLILCTLLAGLMLIAAGLLRLGTLMKYMPQPVVVGFTAGIAVSIFSSQIKDALGLDIAKLPAEFLPRWRTYFAAFDSVDLTTAVLCIGGIVAIVGMRQWRPRWPGFLIVVAVAALLVHVAALPVDTIASRFGGIPSSLPAFAFPAIPFDRTFEMLPASFTIAFLAGVESLLSAVVADGMIGGRHRSNAELVAQGIANCGSALFGGLPATGAIARTATNVRAGARSPLAGILHAAFLLAFMLVAAPLMGDVPLAILAAVLLVVAWNMAEIEHVKHLLHGPIGDRAVLIVTFTLTVVADLTIAIEVGVVLASFLFMHRMSEVVEIESGRKLIEDDEEDATARTQPDQRSQLPDGVEAFQISGPLFFAVANRLDDVLDQFAVRPQLFILRLRRVPMLDASGAQALRQFLDRADRLGIKVFFSGLQPQPHKVLLSMHILEHSNLLLLADNFQIAVETARDFLGQLQHRAER